MKVALYKSAHDGRWLDNAINALSGFGGYSHAELVFSNGISFSSTMRDPSVDSLGRPKPDGTRFKQIDYGEHPERWDLIELKIGLMAEAYIAQFCRDQIDARYDFWGCMRFAVPFVKQHEDKWFCSEVVTAALKIVGYEPLRDQKPHKVSPNYLARLLARKGQ